MATTDIAKVVLNVLTQEQYDEAQTQGTINDNQLYGITDAQDTASNILYDNTASGLNSTDTQSAIDEVYSVVGDNQMKVEDALERGVVQLTTAEMLEALSINGYPDGQLVLCKDDLGYSIGNLYQFRVIHGSPDTYTWVQKTISLPTGTTYYGTQTTLNIADSGKYIVFGDVITLNITANTPVNIYIFGILTNLTLPTTEKTVILNATGYNGSYFPDGATTALADGSKIGAYTVRAIELS